MTEEPERFCDGCGESLDYVRNGTRYSKATSVEVRGVYDGGLFYAHTTQSGGCGFSWHRWEEDKAEGKSNYLSYYRNLRAKAQPYIDRWNRKYYDDDPDRAEFHGHTRPE